MAPNKFEKHIKKQLEEREIRPSLKAWETLSEKIDATSPQSKSKGYLWYGIAASVIGLMILSFYFSSGSSSAESNIQIVDSPKKTEEVIPDKNKFQNDMVDENNAVANVSGESKEKVDKKLIDPQLHQFVNEKLVSINDYKSSKNDQGEKDDNSDIKLVATNKMEAVAQSNPNFIHQEDSQLIKAEELIDTKVFEILAKVNKSEDGVYDLTSIEVDSLLRQAEMELITENLFQDSKTINAMTLLTEVEDELDPTFRDKIFETLRSKFLKARTAVANRNN